MHNRLEQYISGRTLLPIFESGESTPSFKLLILAMGIYSSNYDQGISLDCREKRTPATYHHALAALAWLFHLASPSILLHVHAIVTLPAVTSCAGLAHLTPNPPPPNGSSVLLLPLPRSASRGPCRLLRTRLRSSWSVGQRPWLFVLKKTVTVVGHD